MGGVKIGSVRRPKHRVSEHLQTFFDTAIYHVRMCIIFLFLFVSFDVISTAREGERGGQAERGPFEKSQYLGSLGYLECSNMQCLPCKSTHVVYTPRLYACAYNARKSVSKGGSKHHASDAGAGSFSEDGRASLPSEELYGA